MRVLLATDAAREGVNLQGYCADLLHWELPWNPARIEQRNGRIDRTLQPAPVVRCMYFVYPQRPEDRVLETIVRKVGVIETELGSASAVVLDEIASVLGDGICKATASRVEAVAASGQARKESQRELEDACHRQKRLGHDVAEAGKILEASRRLVELDADLLRDAINVGLALAGADSLAPAASPREEPKLPCFTVPVLGNGWERTLDSLRPAPERGEAPCEWRKRPLLPICFAPPEKLSTAVAHLHLQHPFVQRILARFLAQGFAAQDLSRVTVVRSRKDGVPRVLAFARVTLFGPGATRLHDDLVAVAASWPQWEAPLHVFGDKEDRRAVERLEQLLVESPSLDGVGVRAR